MTYDGVIVGGGHNGLVAACYLAMAGKKILILEKNDYIGGATTSQRVFPDYDAYLSRYAYLVSLFPEQIFDELNLDVTLLSRETASYTPYVGTDHAHTGLIISNKDIDLSKKSMLDLGCGEEEWEGYQTFLQEQRTFASLIHDSFLEPLKSKEEWKAYFKQQGHESLWRTFVEEPIGQLIERYTQSDILRGVLLTDAKICSYTEAHDKSLLQNKTFIYHIIGNKTGEWRVPQGGMGNLVKQLIEKALSLGVSIKSNAIVEEIKIGETAHTVVYQYEGERCEVLTDNVLLNAAPKVLNRLLKQPEIAGKPEEEGAAFKINLLLKKLPALKDTSIRPEQAFSGTFHINQSYTQLQKSFNEIAEGKVPEQIPCEIYCHTLTDPSILSKELQEQGYHTLTVFGLDLPYRLFKTNNEAVKKEVIEKFFTGINEYLAEPLEECLAKDKDGNYCLEAKSAFDIEEALGMPQGNIFHNSLAWFYAETPEMIQKWGVETPHKRIYICGSGAQRGGNVSGVSGRNTAKLILEKD